MEQDIQVNRNFNSISPSAKSIMLLKGHTNIPFARKTAELLSFPEKFNPDFSKRNTTFWARVLHFESRYYSVDKLLEDLSVHNILELSSGFSFRGLAAALRNEVHYIDSDLPDVIAVKKDFINALNSEYEISDGKLELLPLNCLDENQFQEITDHFPAGEIVIVNEGLLMYLNESEKERLCSIIHKILKNRGGYWITADIYLKNKHDKLNLKFDDKTKEFFSEHNIEDKKFDSFTEAEEFFRKMGFIIDREAEVKTTELSSFKHFMNSVSLLELFRIRKTGRIQKTWRLKVEG